VIAYIDGYRGRFGVEPICEVLQVAPSTYFAAKTSSAMPAAGARRGAAVTDPYAPIRDATPRQICRSGG
jgi:putative transposase